MTTRKRAVIYTRISKDRNGESLAVDRQEKACRKLAKLAEMEVVDIFTDNDISAYNGKRRDGFEDMLVAIESGRADVVLCQHTDRLYRRLADLVRLCQAGPNLLIKTIQGGDLDLSTSTGKMLAQILGSVQEQESAHHSERRKSAYVQRAELGVFHNQGNRSFGYTRDGQPIEPEATMYRDAVADLLEGTSLRAIARQWNASGVTTTVAGATRKLKGKEYVVKGVWSSTRIRRLLLNPRYAGIKTHLGKEVETQANWTPLIDEETYRRVVAELSDPTRLKVTSFEKKHVGSGVYVCGVCGAPMQISFPGPGRSQGRKYVCSAHSCVIRGGDPVDDYVENLVVERLSRPDAGLLIAERGVDVGKLQDQRAGWVTKLDRLVDLLDDGTLDGPKARRRAAEYKAEINKIDSQLAQAARTSPTAALLAAGKELRMRWPKLTAGVRGEIISEIATVTINRCGKGKRFDPHAVVDGKVVLDVQWKVDSP
ncbi:recombinase [Mycobacterium numidiamassiliense]|uniref:Recombinase n=1 Tax=Mycobacterium numidiamassiliense TaxID=1841861 RepID=A0A2U3PIP6_9MYCO|nr:recombinase family protein [Mycobacterium numidiamassiliense]SPM43633.1 recombinase [Mycobacterium numidiamassiliense]